MALQRREIMTIGVGALIILSVLVVKIMPDGAAAATSDTLGGAIVRLKEHHRLKQAVTTQAEDLKIEVPTVKPGEQETRVRQELMNLAKQKGLQYSSLRRNEAGGRDAAGGQRPIQFSLDVNGQFDAVVQYVHALDTSKIPFVIKELSVKSAEEGGGQQGGQQKPTGKVKATLRLQSYLFPDVIEPKPEKKEDPAPPEGETNGEKKPEEGGEGQGEKKEDAATTAGTTTENRATTATTVNGAGATSSTQGLESADGAATNSATRDDKPTTGGE